MFLSTFDIFKIGIGPSSSHTIGPMAACRRFIHAVENGDWPRPEGTRVSALRVSLLGSLAFTGIGHATDRAVILGLSGVEPETANPDAFDALVEKAMKSRKVGFPGGPEYAFDPRRDLVFDIETPTPEHANTMICEAMDATGRTVLRTAYYSVGGGFVLDDQEMQRHLAGNDGVEAHVPHPFRNADQMLKMAAESGRSIADMKRANETVERPPEDVRQKVSALVEAMDASIERGLSQDGELPGGLSVKRRAKAIHDKLLEERKLNTFNPQEASEWLSVYAMAVNEENAAGGRIVTAPTNGAAGTLPAVLKYYRQFHADATPQKCEDFILTAAAIGGIIKTNASISGAEVGCQGEVGSASAMAAAGLAAALGGTPMQIENAAEIALEHHLGMTCDPVGGLVQVPCIERNAMGAIKAVSAATLALRGDGTHFVPLDVCVETMRQVGADMDSRYKETSQGGLATNVAAHRSGGTANISVNVPEC
ncbi:MAG: L-serine ammonia-lyase [Pseudomonadota bacterium]